MRSLAETRAELEQAIEDAIAALDRYDGDPDLEDGDEDKAVDDDRCDLADSGDDEPEDEGPSIPYRNPGTADEDQTHYDGDPFGVRP